VRHDGGRVRLDHPALRSEIERLRAVNGGDPDFPLRLRELRSHNSWMHNAPLLTRGGREQPLRVHPDDAERFGLENGGGARPASKSGELKVPVRVTDEVMPGVVALPHGWGHRGGWSLANAAGGVNVNQLMSAAPEDLEPLAGMAFLNGVPVRIQPVVVGEGAGAKERVDAEVSQPAAV